MSVILLLFVIKSFLRSALKNIIMNYFREPSIMDGKPGVKKGVGSITKPSSDVERTLLRIVMEKSFCQDIFK